MKLLFRVTCTLPDGSEGHEVCDEKDIGETLDYINANYPSVVDFKVHVLSEEEKKQPIQ